MSIPLNDSARVEVRTLGNSRQVQPPRNPPIVRPNPIEMSFEADTPSHRRILQEEKARLFGNVVGARVLVIPLFAALLLAFAWFEPWGWRAAVMVLLSVVVPLFFLIELRRYKRFGLEPAAIPRNVVLTAFAQLLVTAATGGILSPIIYGVVPIAGIAGTFMERRHRLILAAVQITSVFAFAALAVNGALGFGSPLLQSDPVRLPALHYYVHAAFVGLVVLGVGQIGHALSGAFAATFRRATNAQRELLVSHTDRIKELTTLSAEIAHELKNPLASIKGLSALLAQNVSDDRGSERVRVLRREIDRMQAALEEFLNFSRPLVPLALKRCNVADLVHEVVALHEGLARQREVRLGCDTASISVSCDPRKVQQVLINLVQNALEASPANAEVTLTTSENDGDALIEVVDEGSGIDLDLGDPFQPGITSKTGGSGIGLTIARALARQHGGDLTLGPNGERGTRAALRLPKDPAAVLEEGDAG